MKVAVLNPRTYVVTDLREVRTMDDLPGQRIVSARGRAVNIGWTYNENTDKFSPPPKPEVDDTQRVAEIKELAGRTILARYNEVKQRNMNARATELLYRRMTNTMTDAEAEELSNLIAAWDWVKEVRARSNRAEAAGTHPAEIEWPQ